MAHAPFPWGRDAKNGKVLRDADGRPVIFAGMTAYGIEAADVHPKIAANTRLVEAIPVLVEALREIAEQDIVSLNLDPDWPRRIARAALAAAGLQPGARDPVGS